jgi:uncharacterized membrane protein YdjX (TVP38/TMEM64 family)/rhodanese-related sulfurtransferase
MTTTGRLARYGLVAIIAAGAVSALVAREQLQLTTVEANLHELGAWLPAAFIASFVVGTLVFVPGSLFGLAGGALFGPVWGMVFNLVGAMLGATLAFLVARYLGADWIARKAVGKLQTILQGAQAEGWRVVALARVIPVIPFSVLNYALGLTGIPLSHYVVATLVCMMPGTAAYAWLGYAGRAAVEGDDAALRYGLLGLALFAAIALAPRLYKRLRGTQAEWITVPELKQRLASGPPAVIIDVRDHDEFIGPLGHIPGARNVPLAALPHAVAGILPQKGATTVVVCKTDKRSSKAALRMRAAGLQNVVVLSGGMEAWSRGGSTSS